MLMKKIVYALAALLALAGCAKDETRDEVPVPAPEARLVTITASFDPATKTAYDARGKFSWAAGDKIGVLVSNGQETRQVTFVAQASGASTSFSGEVPAGFELKDAASYPFEGVVDGYISNDLVWDAAKGGWRIWGSIKPSLEDPLSCIPLIGIKLSGTKDYRFASAAGVVKFTVQDVPMETAFAYLEVPAESGSNLNGWYDLSGTGYLSMAGAVEPWKDRYNWNVPTAEHSTLDYYFFLPVGTLPQGTRFELRNAAWETLCSAEFQKEVAVQRNVVTSVAPLVLGEVPEPVETPGTGLRTVHIDTPDGKGITSKDNWTEGCRMVIVDDSGHTYYSSDAVQVKGRGNSTWTYPKKPYAIKLPEKTDLIGTGADKSWVLMANWMDRTLLRNEVAFELGRRSGLSWTPSGEFVELYLNGKHQGNYWLGEKVKTGKARLTADFLIEMDTYYDADWRFYSQYGRRVNENRSGMPIGVKEPDDDMTEELFATLKSLVAGVEESLYLGTGDYRTLLDAASFADWYLVHELCWNGEPNHPKSCYFHFRDGVMYAGPLWDFDWYTFQPSMSGLLISKSIYFEKLLADASFCELLRTRWAALKPSFETMGDYIDAKAAEIHASEPLNWALWPCTSSSVNGDERMSFDAAVARLKNALNQRIETLDAAVRKL